MSGALINKLNRQDDGESGWRILRCLHAGGKRPFDDNLEPSTFIVECDFGRVFFNTFTGSLSSRMPESLEYTRDSKVGTARWSAKPTWKLTPQHHTHRRRRSDVP